MSIKKSPTIYFVLISLFLLGVVSCSKKVFNTQNISKDSKKISMIPVSDSLLKLRTAISFKKAQISGIMLVKQRNDSLIGAFVNEFGIKGFEFVVTNNRCKLTNVFSFLDKWYIRRTISSDLQFMFSSIYVAERDTLGVLTTGSGVSYHYSLASGKVIRLQRMSGSQKTGEAFCLNDSVFEVNNIQRKLTYKMAVIRP